MVISSFILKESKKSIPQTENREQKHLKLHPKQIVLLISTKGVFGQEFLFQQRCSF